MWIALWWGQPLSCLINSARGELPELSSDDI